MPEPEGVESRVTELEHAITRLREQIAVSGADSMAARVDSAAARTLAGGADRDSADIRTALNAHTKTLNALRETQVEQGVAMKAGFDLVNNSLGRITALLDQVLGNPPQQ